ncbi:MAG: low molecular weight phosphatase family protein [Candidatus Korarchaeota archaeon]|nr:low molecular weight phosphatase family protein [Candidatus Korarchaeota archaeon]NIU83234.1 low molecular weight phosphatase family protein [Candidatus Thorarchaeota archaeon]NIW13180.1 low molecular weight phosphatase family protein [Candidatus Thorarchaeota archaeon]NIW51321.1 low molecular weight phosphatase family protein [Candidatus Korarchaeota archaeon]
MATAFAKREVKERNLDFDIIMGGTRPAKHVPPVGVKAMREKGFEVADKKPRKISPSELEECGYVITMGCSAENVCPMGWGGESREWDLEDPKGKRLETVRKIRDTVEQRVKALFDGLVEKHVKEGSM